MQRLEDRAETRVLVAAFDVRPVQHVQVALIDYPAKRRRRASEPDQADDSDCLDVHLAAPAGLIHGAFHTAKILSSGSEAPLQLSSRANGTFTTRERQRRHQDDAGPGKPRHDRQIGEQAGQHVCGRRASMATALDLGNCSQSAVAGDGHLSRPVGFISVYRTGAHQVGLVAAARSLRQRSLPAPLAQFT